MTTSTPAKGVRPPRQSRSAGTLARIVDAARSLLDETSFADLAISQIMKRAGMSVGSFYTRFRNKEALLPYIYAHYDEELERTTRAALQPEHWAGKSLADRVRGLVDLSVDSYRENRGLWRAVLLHASSNPDIVTEDHSRRRIAMVSGFVALLLERREEIAHPDPDQAVEFCMVLLFATCKDQILLADRSHGTTKLSDQRLKDQLTLTLTRLLGVSDEAS